MFSETTEKCQLYFTIFDNLISSYPCYNITMTDSEAPKKHSRSERRFFAFDNILVFIAAGCCLMWTWGSISAMTRNWTLSQELIEREREKALLELEVETLELENDYYRSDEYKELSARKYQNKKLPGETMIYLPSNSDAAKSKHNNDATSDSAVDTPQLDNFEQWMAFLFGM